MSRQTINTVANVVMGGAMGVGTGYCYHKYSKVNSIGFGLGGLLLSQYGGRIRQGILKKVLDRNHDGRLDLEDVVILEGEIEERTSVKVTIFGFLAFGFGFGGGYLVGMFY